MRRMNLFAVAAVFVLLPLLCRSAVAQIEPGTFTFVPNVGLYTFDDNQNISNAPVYGAGFGYNYSERIGVEAAFNYADSDVEFSDDNVEAYVAHIDALYHFMPDKVFVPYVAAGLGTISINDTIGTETNGLFNYGAGFKYFLSKTFAFRGDVRHIFDIEDSNNNFAFTMGFAYMFGGKKEAAPVTAPVTVDSDGDGVPDDIDECPGTPSGISVDSVGCPMDGDGDGVYDHLDTCPGTPAGMRVDSDGCPVDSDGDGVNDAADMCPGTPRGIKVDNKGCPLAIEEEVSIDLRVQFDFDSAVVKDEYVGHINNVAEFLKKYPGVDAVIEGHTCSIGTEEYNMKLSRRRAESVMRHLIDKGVDGGRLKAVGHGETRPSADNSTKEGREKNRRVMASISTIVIKLQ